MDKDAEVVDDSNRNRAEDRKVTGEDQEANITAINLKDNSLDSANDQNKTVNDIISELDQDKDNKADKQTADANLASRDAKPLDQTLPDAGPRPTEPNDTDKTMDRAFIEESMNQGDATNQPPIEKQASFTPSTITQHGSVNEKGDKDLHLGDLGADADKRNFDKQNNANKKYDEKEDALEKLTTRSEPDLLADELKQDENVTALDQKDAEADKKAAQAERQEKDKAFDTNLTEDTYKA